MLNDAIKTVTYLSLFNILYGRWYFTLNVNIGEDAVIVFPLS